MVQGSASKKRRILLLCHYYPGAAGAIIDHIEAFRNYSENEYFILSNLGDLPPWLELSRFDALVFHYSLVACYDNYISPDGRARIRDFKGFKAAFVQDDYRWVDDTVNALAYMRIHALFPLAGADIIDAVYSPEKLPGVRKETVLAGYVPQSLVALEVPDYASRTRDVGYRARKLPAWMGSHTLQKWEIAERFSRDAARHELSTDISVREEDRIYGDQWIEFITNSRATLGTESGASVCDFTGEIQRKVEAHMARDPSAEFEVLRDLYFKDNDGKIMMNVISPRCFEAAALRTLMILYEGAYSGVLIPGRHYVPLKRDHSNMDQVVRVLRDPDKAQKIINQAYDEVARNHAYSYAAMVELVDRVMREEWSEALAPAQYPFGQCEFAWMAEHGPRSNIGVTAHPSRTASWHSQHPSKVDTEEAGARTIALDRPTKVTAIAFRWAEEGETPAMHLELTGFRRGRKQFTQVMDKDTGDNFWPTALTRQSPAVDLLKIRLIAKRESPPLSPLLSVNVLGVEPASTRRGVAVLKRTLLRLMVACWNLLPEKIRDRLRPATEKIIGQVVRLLT